MINEVFVARILISVKACCGAQPVELGLGLGKGIGLGLGKGLSLGLAGHVKGYVCGTFNVHHDGVTSFVLNKAGKCPNTRVAARH